MCGRKRQAKAKGVSVLLGKQLAGLDEYRRDRAGSLEAVLFDAGEIRSLRLGVDQPRGGPSQCPLGSRHRRVSYCERLQYDAGEHTFLEESPAAPHRCSLVWASAQIAAFIGRFRSRGAG